MDQVHEIARASRERDRFEALWARYVESLEVLDEAKARVRAARVANKPSHAFRVLRGARKAVERLRLRLVADYDMKLEEES